MYINECLKHWLNMAISEAQKHTRYDTSCLAADTLLHLPEFQLSIRGMGILVS